MQRIGLLLTLVLAKFTTKMAQGTKEIFLNRLNTDKENCLIKKMSLFTTEVSSKMRNTDLDK